MTIADEPCTYGGQPGNVPEATDCRQMYSLHKMLTLSENGTEFVMDNFKIPSACVCHVDKTILHRALGIN